MNFEIYIYTEEKQESFYKAAMAEYEKRLTRYCKLKVKYIKKEKDVDKLIASEEKLYVVIPGDHQKSSEELSAWIGEMENSGRKKLVFFIPGPKILEKKEEEFRKADKIDFFSLSDFDMGTYLFGVVLEEQIYRAYRILNNHPYHK